jgi:hypothetical protein
MKNSINHPWAISEKYISRYGNLWANLDFEFSDKVTTEQFKNDPMNVEVGSLIIDGRHLDFKYKDLILYSKQVEELSINVYATSTSKTEQFDLTIKGRVFQLKRHELGKLATTLAESVHVLARKYELGLYL